ncbi:MAG: hypothetical protein QOI43_2907 [Gaiellales bacterium]|jgi:hypothetical protein|nr:hypothetical protein [Gaiellales bacterium]
MGEPERETNLSVAIQPFSSHDAAMNFEIDKIPPEDEGDGLPNMKWRLRVIVASMLGSSVVWAGVISLLR